MKRETRNLSDVQFELRFYEGILKQCPDFIEVLIALGEIYTKIGLYEKGLAVDKKLAYLRPEDPVILYNLACSYSLLHRIDGAFRTIQLAVFWGYDNFAFMERDEDLHNLHQNPQFQEFLAKLKNSKPV